MFQQIIQYQATVAGSSNPDQQITAVMPIIVTRHQPEPAAWPGACARRNAVNHPCQHTFYATYMQPGIPAARTIPLHCLQHT
jgi:hypothetical protein